MPDGRSRTLLRPSTSLTTSTRMSIGASTKTSCGRNVEDARWRNHRRSLTKRMSDNRKVLERLRVGLGRFVQEGPVVSFRRYLCVVRCAVERVFSREEPRHGRLAMSNLVAEKNVVAEKLELLKSRAAIRAVDVANMLGTTPETVSRWNQGRAYPRPAKESLLVDLEYIVERLSEFYSDPKTARSWLYSRHRYFSGLRPADLIQEGRIEEVLEAIQAMADPTYT